MYMYLQYQTALVSDLQAVLRSIVLFGALHGSIARKHLILTYQAVINGDYEFVFE